MKPNDMSNKDMKNKNVIGDTNQEAHITNMPKDKTAVNNLKKPDVSFQGESCPVDPTKGMSYLPPKDENTL
ncbi:MAG: hypothetical protein ACXWDO_01190 [Bacteroidia bacterium]